MTNLLPIREMPGEVCRRLRGIFCDLDDTLTIDGKLLDDSFHALWQAHRSGLRTVIVTGRPAGWADHIARMWPVDAVIGENGAFYFWMENNKMRRHFVQDASARKEGQRKLEQVLADILREVPRAAISADQKYRESDLAVDYREDIEPLSTQETEKILAIFAAAGATAKISSIHINGWFGDFDKSATCRSLLERLWKEHCGVRISDYAYCGDSPNDEPMFAVFSESVGVANISPWIDSMAHLPKYRTENSGAHGFAEMVEHILKERRRVPAIP